MPATRLTRIGVGAWAFVAVLPGALSAARGALEPPGADMAATLRELYSPEVAAYLGACPRPMLAYTLPALLVAPAVLVCAAVGLRDDPIPAGAFGFEAGAALVGRECGRARPHRGSHDGSRARRGSLLELGVSADARADRVRLGAGGAGNRRRRGGSAPRGRGRVDHRRCDRSLGRHGGGPNRARCARRNRPRPPYRCGRRSMATARRCRNVARRRSGSGDRVSVPSRRAYRAPGDRLEGITTQAAAARWTRNALGLTPAASRSGTAHPTTNADPESSPASVTKISLGSLVFNVGNADSGVFFGTIPPSAVSACRV